MNYEICVIGSEAFLFPFLQFGFATYTPPSKAALHEYLEQIIGKNYGIIYIEDSYCFWVKDLWEQYRSSLTPAIIPIGENREGGNFSQQVVKELMERAIGQNVNTNG